VFDVLLPEKLRFAQDDAVDLAQKLRELDTRRRPELRDVVERRHSVDHWADGLLATVRP